MKAAVMTDTRTPLEMRTLPDPEPGPTDAVVRIVASGICRSDWHIWNGDWSWLGLTPQLPLVSGHEVGGVVVAVGPEVRNVKEGDRVTVPFHLACGRCTYCFSGHSHLCQALGFLGFSIPGGFAEAVRVPNADATVVRLPDGVDLVSAAALGCRFMTAYHGLVDRAKVAPGEWVAIYGVGGVGLSTVQIAAALGARVIAIGRSDDKLTEARTQGAVATVNAGSANVAAQVKELTGEGGADIAVDALGASATALPAVHSLKKGGRLLQLGMTSQEDQGNISLPIDVMVVQELSLITSVGCPTTSYPGLLSLVASGRLTPKQLVGRTVALDEITSVFEDMTAYRTHGLTVITDLRS